MIAYLIKSGLCLVILLGIYLLFLEREKMHRFNRFFLLFAVIVGLSVPQINLNFNSNASVAGIELENVERVVQLPAKTINELSTSSTELITETISSRSKNKVGISDKEISAKETKLIDNSRAIEEQTISGNDNSFNLSDAILLLYLIIAFSLILRLIYGLYGFRAKKRSAAIINYGSAHLALVSAKIVPHTFLNTIYVNKTQFESGELSKEILDHELTHARQKHSLDVLFIELLRIVFWFNPIFYFYKRAIQINHEFLADDSVITKTQDSVSYQKLLLESIFPTYQTNLASTFNYSLTKKRFKMMVKEYSFLSVATKKIVMIPILLSVALIFCTDNTTQKTTRINGVEYWYGFLSNDTYSKVKILTKVQERDSITNSNKWTFYDGNGNPFSGSNTIYLKENDKVYSISKFENGRLLSRVLFSDKDEEVFRTENEFRNGLLFTTSTSLRDTLYQKSTYPPFTKNNSRIFQRFYPNGNLQFEYGTKQEAERQFYHGLLTLYGEDGDIIEQELYENGERVPITREFLEERYLELRTRYKKTLAEYLNMEVSMSSMEELNIAYWELKTAQARRFALEKKLDTTGVTPPPPPIPPNPEQRLKNAN